MNIFNLFLVSSTMDADPSILQEILSKYNLTLSMPYSSQPSTSSNCDGNDVQSIVTRLIEHQHEEPSIDFEAQIVLPRPAPRASVTSSKSSFASYHSNHHWNRYLNLLLLLHLYLTHLHLRNQCKKPQVYVGQRQRTLLCVSKW